MVILRSQNKITDLLMILAWASPFSYSSLRRRELYAVGLSTRLYVFINQTIFSQDHHCNVLVTIKKIKRLLFAVAFFLRVMRDYPANTRR